VSQNLDKLIVSSEVSDYSFTINGCKGSRPRVSRWDRVNE